MAIIKRSTSTIVGLDTVVSDLNANIAAEALARSTADGVLSSLATTEKTNLVGALNEVKGALDSEATARKAGQFTTLNYTYLAGPYYVYDTTSHAWVKNTNLADTPRSISTIADVLNYTVDRVWDNNGWAKASYEYLDTRINNVLSNVDATALNSLTEIVAAFQSADQTINGAITTLAANSSAAITAEQTARTTADNEIKNALVAYGTSTHDVTARIANFLATTSSNSLWNALLQNDLLGINYLGALTRSISTTSATYTADVLSSSLTYQSLPKITSAYGIYLVLPAEKPSNYPNSVAINHIPDDNTFLRVNNFKSVRTVIEGQAYDLEVGIMYEIAKNNTILLVIELASANEVTMFTGKTFKVEYTVTKEFSGRSNNIMFSQVGDLLSYTGVTSGNFTTKTLNTASTPWGALV